MPQVRFVNENLAIEVAPGTLLPDAVAAAGSRFPFGCRRGSCGTCRCFVLKGLENLNPKTEQEEFLFDTLTAVEPHERLGCQLVIYGDVDLET